MNTRRWALVAVPIVVLGAGAVTSAALLSGSDAPKQLPPEKQAILDKYTQRRAAAAAGPHASKQSLKVAKSCPRHMTPGIFRPRAQPFGRNIVNAAMVVAPGGAGFEVSAGALDGETNQGVLIVRRNLGDTCAWARAGEPSDTRQYLLPAEEGAATITRIEGVIVVFTTASGDTGRFNAVTGKFQ
jgi:hypothetical protein